MNYTIESQELMNLFLKGLENVPDILKWVIDKSPLNYYNLKDKMILVVKNQQLLCTIKGNQYNPTFRDQPNVSTTTTLLHLSSTCQMPHN